MRIFILSLIILFFCSFSGCGGDEEHDRYNTDHVKLNATINNTNETISLGDTLKISLALPDTVISTEGTFPVQSLQSSQFAMHFIQVDTLNKKGIFVKQPAYWSSPATSNSFNFSFSTTKPYRIDIYFKPQQKGLYYLSVVSQPGHLIINNANRKLLFVNFDVPDKHYNILSLIAPYFGGQPYYDAGFQRNAEGFGMYFFRVD